MSSRAVEKNRETSIRGRRLLTLIATIGGIAAVAASTLVAGLVAAGPAAAQDAQEQARVQVTVVETTGLLDRISAEFLTSVIDDAGPRDVLVVRLDVRDSVLDDGELAALADRMGRVHVWVGPGRGARAGGEAAVLLEHARTVGTTSTAPTLGDFLLDLDVPSTVVRRDEGPPQRRLAPHVGVRFAEPPFTQQVLHAVSTPTAAYLLLSVGLLLVVFEFFTGGIGVAAGVAIVSLALAGYGLGALPTRPLALVALAVGALGFAVDVQVGVPRAWTAIGTASFTAGSFFLFTDGLRVPLPALVAVLAGVLLMVVAGIPAVVRTRYSTPTIGRESMIGEVGTAATDVSPDGVVAVREARWRARTNRATPIRAGDAVRVAAIDGLLLEVEPLEGAARDAGH